MIKRFFKPDAPAQPELPPRPLYFHRLSPEVMRDLEAKLGNLTIVTTTTTDLQAGYALGVQRVLQLLREGYVDETAGTAR